MLHRAYSLLNVKEVVERTDDYLIRGIASTPTPDRMGDIVEPMGAKFALPMPLLWQHKPDKPVGRVMFAKPTKDGIPFEASIPNVKEPGTLKDRIDEAVQSIKYKLVAAVSIGFSAVDGAVEVLKGGGLRFMQWEWLELSLVTIPANAEATLRTVKSIDSEHLPRPAGSGVVHLLPGASGSIQPKKETGTMKPIQEQIAAFEAKRAASTSRMSDIMSKAAEEGRTLDQAETEEYDTLAGEVKSVDDHLTRLRTHERTIVAKAAPVVGADGSRGDADAAGQRARDAGAGIISVRSNTPKGHAFTKYAMLLLASKGNLMQAAEMAKAHCQDDPRIELVLKAAVAAGTTTDSTWAAPLLPYQDMAGEFIELLRPMTILGKIGPSMRNVPFNIRVARETAGATAGWVGQGKPKPVGKLSFDTVSLPWSKIAVIIALTEELVRFSSPSAVAVCQNDMLKTIAKFMDEQFISPSVAISANVSPASVLNGVTATPSTGTTVASIMTDVMTLRNRFHVANQDMDSAFWVMNPRTVDYLAMLRTAQDVFAFPSIEANGTFFRRPIIASQSVSLDYGSPSATYIALINAADVLLADDGQITLDVSREASVQMDSAPSDGAQSLVSFWQNNLVGLRAERYVHWLKRRSSAAYFIDGVTY